MSTNESLTQSDEAPLEQAITIQPSAITAYPSSGDWMSAGGADPAQEGTGGLALLHAARRHWLVILSTGLACAAVTGVVLALVLKKQYKAEAYLDVALGQPIVVQKGPDEAPSNSGEFEIFRNNQVKLIKSRFVIIAALRDPRLKNRACIVREDAMHNAIQWLTDEIRVEVDKTGGILIVNATQPDPQDAAAMANAVVEAYMNEVVDKDRQQRRDRLSDLQQITADKESEVRNKRDQLKREEDNIGVSDEDSMKTRIALVTSIYADFERQFLNMRAEHRGLLAKLQEAKRARDQLLAGNTEIPQTEVVMLLNTNPQYHDLKNRFEFLDQVDKQRERIVVNGVKPPPSVLRSKADLDYTKTQLKSLEDEARDQVHAAKRIALEADIRRLESQIDITTEQLAAFEKEVKRKRSDADNVGRSSPAMKMAKADVDNLEHVLHSVADERERLRVELSAKSRVTVLGDRNAPAAVPENEMRDYHVLFVFAGSVFAMFLPALGIVMWDLRKARINSAGEVSKRLNIPVIGAVPLIPVTVMRRLADTTQRSQIWKMRFTESVDGVAARLLRKSACDQTRVVLVTSALHGEGKTTLATQLAMSLARAQRRTVLVDFDLRQPTLDGALGLPSGPGICEALRGEGDIMDMVQQTETECLSVVTAGAWNRQALVALSNGTVAALLDQLRMNFEFVIIDSSPLLPIVDTRLVCQHVDSVMLSVFRDISQGPKVLAAHEMLEAFGVRSVEAVVTGGEEHGNAKNLALQAARLDKQVMPPENEADLLADRDSPEENPQ